MSFNFKTYDKSQIPELLELLRQRADETPDSIVATVREVLENVKKGGDKALREYGLKFDKVERDELFLTQKERDEYIAKCPKDLRKTIENAAKNIFEFHEKQKHTGYITASDGKVMGQRVLPLARVGMYVPGGTAAYPSSVLMTAIPATVAGV
nr:histidinol dehydrogenase [Clostridia bacterium]